MHKKMTTGGTAIFEMTPAEHDTFLEREVEKTLGMSSQTFRECAYRGEVDWDDPDAFYVAGILGIGQNGHRDSR